MSPFDVERTLPIAAPQLSGRQPVAGVVCRAGVRPERPCAKRSISASALAISGVSCLRPGLTLPSLNMPSLHATDPFCWLVGSEVNLNRVPQQSLGGPRQIRNLDDELGLDPMHPGKEQAAIRIA
jgi:hypothetical protein